MLTQKLTYYKQQAFKEDTKGLYTLAFNLLNSPKTKKADGTTICL